MTDLGRKLKLAARKASGEKPFSSSGDLYKSSSSPASSSTSAAGSPSPTSSSSSSPKTLSSSAGSEPRSTDGVQRGAAPPPSRPAPPPKPKVAFERPSSSPNTPAPPPPTEARVMRSSFADDSPSGKGWKVTAGRGSPLSRGGILGSGRATTPTPDSDGAPSPAASGASAAAVRAPPARSPRTTPVSSANSSSSSTTTTTSPSSASGGALPPSMPEITFDPPPLVSLPSRSGVAPPQKPLPPPPPVADLKVGPLMRLAVNKAQTKEKWCEEFANLDKHYLRFYGDEARTIKRKRIPLGLAKLSDISLIKGSNIYSFSLSSLGNTLSIKVGSMSEADLRSWYDMIRECQGRGNSLRGGVIPMPKREAATSSGSSALRPERPVGGVAISTKDMRRAVRASAVASQLFSMPERRKCAECSRIDTCFEHATKGFLCLECQSKYEALAQKTYASSKPVAEARKSRGFDRKSRKIRLVGNLNRGAMKVTASQLSSAVLSQLQDEPQQTPSQAGGSKKPPPPAVPERKAAAAVATPPKVPPKPEIDKKSVYSMPQKSMFDSDDSDDDVPSAGKKKDFGGDAYSVPDDDGDDRFSDRSGAYGSNDLTIAGGHFDKKKLYSDAPQRGGADEDDEELLIDEEEPEEEEVERVEEDDFLSDSDSDEDEDDKSGDWNQRFQAIIESMERGGSIHSDLSTYLALIGLAQDFLYSATSYGKIIISEVYLTDSEKTIKPAARVGGVAGGSKYIVQDILFKFALDIDGLYGSNDTAASKVGGHELKGLQAYFNCQIEGLSLPFMALVDYRGFRLIAISLLPISRKTIVYGSDDGGNTIHDEDDNMRVMMKKAADILNIKEHMAGYNPNQRKLLYSAADIEGHRGTDGRYYLIDFSRTFPPQLPDRNIKGSNLFRLFRPEFVKSYIEAVCSDAYSNFCSTEHNKTIDIATKYLREVVVPSIGRELPGILEASGASIRHFRLTEIVHSRGCNVRHLGIVLNAVDKMAANSRAKQQCHSMLLVEMFARVIKEKLRALLRNRMKKLRKPLEEPYRKLVVDYLNLVFGNKPKSDEYWDTTLKREVMKKFEGVKIECIMYIPTDIQVSEKKAKRSQRKKTLPPAAAAPTQLTSMRQMFQYNWDGVDLRCLLVERLQQMMGLKFSQQTEKDLFVDYNGRLERSKPFSRTDLEGIGERIKHMNIVSHAEGYLLVVKAMQCRATDSATAIGSLKSAIQKFEEVLNSNTNSKVTLKHCARALLLLDEEIRRQTRGAFDMNNPNILRARKYFLKALEIDPNDPTTLCQYAQFLQLCGEVESAEENFLRALELDPTDVEAMRSYAALLEERGEYDAAEKFFIRITQRDDYKW